MLKEKRKVVEVITISESDGTDANSDSDWPGWLPDGWERVSRRKNNQDISFYYTCPKCSGITFHTQAEVLRHCIFLCEDAPLKLRALFRKVQENVTLKCPQPVQQKNRSPPLRNRHILGSSAKEGRLGNDLFDSIPHGWTIEIRRGPIEYGKMYKFYVDPTKEFRFSSKEEMQFYLKEGKHLCHSSGEILYCDTKGEENMIAKMTFSSEGLPYGWIKETRYRHYSRYKSGIRKDVYYIDPNSGTEFRSMKEVERHLIGKVVKQARVPRRSITNVFSFEGSTEMPEYLARRFSSRRGYTSKNLINDIDGDDDDDNIDSREEFMEGGTEHDSYISNCQD